MAPADKGGLLQNDDYDSRRFGNEEPEAEMGALTELIIGIAVIAINHLLRRKDPNHRSDHLQCKLVLIFLLVFYLHHTTEV